MYVTRDGGAAWAGLASAALRQLVIQACLVPAVTFAAFVIFMPYLQFFCKLHTSDRLIILHIDCILVFIVYCFFVCFFSITR